MLPSQSRQGKRLTPQFRALQEALVAETTELAESTNAPDPEFVIVFEVAGTIDRFMQAAQGVEGLAFITEFVGDGIDPDDEFYNVDDKGERAGTKVRQTLYLVMANTHAIAELVRLFELYQNDKGVEFERGLAPLKKLFAELHTVRRWGAVDRIAETGLLEDWKEHLDMIGQSGFVRVEIELVWKTSQQDRAAAQVAVERLLPGRVFISTAEVDAINYHAILADLTAQEVEAVLDDGAAAISLLRADDVFFVSPARPMSLLTAMGEAGPMPEVDTTPVTLAPKAALLDGLPLSNHDVLAGRLSIDDPSGRSALYSPQQCGHGTSMASLIIHGDLSNPGVALTSFLYVHPVMVPHKWVHNTELVPSDELIVDIIHRAFQHMFGGANPQASSVRVVNISLGDPARVFVRRLSPLARLLDYFAHLYNLLIVVSAGNQKPGDLSVPVEILDDRVALDSAVRREMRRTGRFRRMFSPAEAINVMTVGSIHADASNAALPGSVLDPLLEGSVATYSPFVSGLRGSPKPELLAPGGRVVVQRPIGTSGEVGLEPANSVATGPGIQVAAPSLPGATNGTAYTFGTSNSAALVTRSAVKILDFLEEASNTVGQSEFPEEQYHPVLTKALLIHSAIWPDRADQWAKDFDATGKNRRRLLTQYLGFGILAPERIAAATPKRVTLIGAGTIANKKRHSFRFPLPPGLASAVGWRRLIVTLAWLSPTVPSTQQYRTAQLSFGSPRPKWTT